MKVELTKQECCWLAELAHKAKVEAVSAYEVEPHPLFELRRDNMADLEGKLNAAMQKELHRARRDAR